MYKIVDGIMDELKKENVKITYNIEIVDFVGNNKRLDYLIDNKGNKLNSDVILVNGDAAVFGSKIFKRKEYSFERLDKMSWTMGYLTFYIG
jgi:phytoene desaturase